MNDFDAGEADQLFDGIETALADLAHIDRVLEERAAFYAAHGDVWGPEEELLGAAIPVGTRHPFDIKVYAARGSSWRASSAEWRAEAEAWAHECVQGARDATRHLAEVDTGRISAVVDALHYPSTELGISVPLSLEHDVLEPMDALWRGEAMNSFTRFLSHSIIAVTHQGWLIEAIRVALVQAKAVADMSQIELIQLLRGQAASLDEQLRKRVEDEAGSESLILFFLFASTATGVLSAIALPKAIAGLSSVMGVASPLLGAAKDAVPQSDRDLEKVPARHAREYAEHLRATVDQMLHDANVRWDRAHASGAAEIHERMDNLGRSHRDRAFVPPLPTIAEGPVALEDFTST